MDDCARLNTTMNQESNSITFDEPHKSCNIDATLPSATSSSIGTKKSASTVPGRRPSSTQKNKSEGLPSLSDDFPSGRLLICGLFVVLGGGFHFGYQMSVINPMLKPLQEFLRNSTESRYKVRFSDISIGVFWSAIAGVLFLGAAIGATIVPPVISLIGSRWCLIINTLTMTCSLLLSPLSYYTNFFELYIISRIITGICVGAGTTVQGVFLTEISPVICRGLMGTFTGLSTNIGFFLASAIGLPQFFGTSTLWNLAYWIEIIPCLLLLFYAVFYLQESPIYYLRKGNEKDAHNSIKYYYRPLQISENIVRNLQSEIEASRTNISGQRIVWDKATRQALLISMILNSAVSFSGVIALSFFGTSLLAAIGFTNENAALANCLSSLSGTAGIILGAITIDKIGRRILIIGSLLSLICVNMGMMVLVWIFTSYPSRWHGYIFLFLFIAFLLVFSVGIGPAAWFISTELAGPYERARIQSLSISAQYITCFLCPIIYFPLHQLVGPLSFILFIGPLTCASIYIFIYLPETRRRTDKEIKRMLQTGKRY